MIKYIFIALFIFPLSACLEKEETPSQTEAEAELEIYKTKAGPQVKAEYSELDSFENRLNIVTAEGKEHIFNIEVAVTAQEKSQGLMHRTELADNAGMLFYFGNELERRFWMKNTLIPLDMLFIRADGTIHSIHENAIPHDLTGIPSHGPAAGVLEINGGMSKKLGIKAGDQVQHEFFSYSLTQ